MVLPRNKRKKFLAAIDAAYADAKAAYAKANAAYAEAKAAYDANSDATHKALENAKANLDTVAYDKATEVLYAAKTAYAEAKAARDAAEAAKGDADAIAKATHATACRRTIVSIFIGIIPLVIGWGFWWIRRT